MENEADNMNLSPEILGPGIGYTLSIILFVVGQMRGSKATHEITKLLKDDKVIRDYLEWLRREDQETLLQNIETSKDQLLQEFSSLGSDIQDFADRVLETVQATEQEILDQLKDINGKLKPPVLSPVPLQTRALSRGSLRVARVATRKGSPQAASEQSEDKNIGRCSQQIPPSPPAWYIPGTSFTVHSGHPSADGFTL